LNRCLQASTSSQCAGCWTYSAKLTLYPADILCPFFQLHLTCFAAVPGDSAGSHLNWEGGEHSGQQHCSSQESLVSSFSWRSLKLKGNLAELSLYWCAGWLVGFMTIHSPQLLAAHLVLTYIHNGHYWFVDYKLYLHKYEVNFESIPLRFAV
jgi:hypothetical protein